MKEYKRYLITAALPYANGPVHIGHLAGVYVPADIYVRYLRLRGRDVLFVCGSDEHGVPITIKARQENVSPQVIVDRYHEMNKQDFLDFGIEFDWYSRTTEKIHYRTARAFFKKLDSKGVFVKKTTKQYFDEEVKQFLADRYITGTCPICGNPSAYGDQCESCGTSLNATDLKDPRSTLSGSTPVLRDTKHWFLPLDQYEPFLRRWILEENKHWKVNVYGQCKSWLDAGLQPRAVTRDLDWGIPVPVEGAEGKVLYVWFDAPIGYISATKEHFKKIRKPREWERYWKRKTTSLIHFIGKDNIVFHCIVFPTMLKAEGSFILPKNVPANEFLNLEGDKISTSRNWAVWLHEYLEDFPEKQDVLRYTLCANAPETKDNDFTWRDLQARNNNELVAILGNFVNRTLMLTIKNFDSKVPVISELTTVDNELINIIKESKDEISNNLEVFKFREALKSAMNLARVGNKYLSDTEPWKIINKDRDRVGTILNLSLQTCANLAIALYPFLPRTSEKLKHFLDEKFRTINLDPLEWDDLGNINLLKPGDKIQQADFLFEKIEDNAIEKQLEKLRKTKELNTSITSNIKPQKESITYEQFAAMDIRVGTILEAEKVPKTKKLMKLLIDAGIDKRTVVSGIAEFFEPEKLTGRRVTILLNLKPRKIKGIESQGMILMAEDEDGTLKLVIPDVPVKPGSEVK
jgi:methionyl-tRNA synthetase